MRKTENVRTSLDQPVIKKRREPHPESADYGREFFNDPRKKPKD